MKATYDAEVRAGNVHTPRWGRSGFYAEVVKEGTVHAGDPIILKEDQ
jgi:MOSC domain-containing protein YiiM